MSIGAGMIIPTLIRWYWWRMNGYGFAIGTAAGMMAAIIQRFFMPDVPEYIAFSFASGISLVGTILGTHTTKPTDEIVLSEFYKKTRPFGFWGNFKNQIPSSIMKKVNRENRRDIISVFMAVPWQLTLFMMWMMLIMRHWDQFGFLLGLLVLLSIGLYFTWFRHLSSEVKLDSK